MLHIVALFSEAEAASQVYHELLTIGVERHSLRVTENLEDGAYAPATGSGEDSDAGFWNRIQEKFGLTVPAPEREFYKEAIRPRSMISVVVPDQQAKCVRQLIEEHTAVNIYELPQDNGPGSGEP
jgi:hypothetical protein